MGSNLLQIPFQEQAIPYFQFDMSCHTNVNHTDESIKR